jgi:hypothetical protein
LSIGLVKIFQKTFKKPKFINCEEIIIMMNLTVNEKMNKAVEIFINYECTKTGYSHTKFAGFEDFAVDEVEMLSYLFENCPETLEIIEQQCEHWKVEFKKANSVSWLVMQSSFALNKIYKFGWMNRNKVDELDTIKDISEIDLKPNHIHYLNLLREHTPNVDNLFVSYYNQTQRHMNPFRVEQVFHVLKNNKIPYGEYTKAVKHAISGDWTPYFAKSNYGYYIVDNYGCFAGQLFLSPKDFDTKELDWTYMASRNADRWHGDKNRAETEVKKLYELNKIAGIEGLSWEVKYLNRNDIPDVLAKYDKWIDKHNNSHLFINKDIPKGKKTEHRKLSSDVHKKFKEILNQIGEAFRAGKEVINV